MSNAPTATARKPTHTGQKQKADIRVLTVDTSGIRPAKYGTVELKGKVK